MGSLKGLVKNVAFFSIESVVYDGQGDIVALSISLEESSEASVELRIDFILRVDDFFPPGAAHEE